MPRTWVYSHMIVDGALYSVVETRIFGSTAIDTVPSIKPFILYRETSDVGVVKGDDGHYIKRNGYMIFVHDVPGDYLQIDTVIRQLENIFDNVKDENYNVVRSEWIETSDDLRDEDLGTILKFIRIQVTYRV